MGRAARRPFIFIIFQFPSCFSPFKNASVFFVLEPAYLQFSFRPFFEEELAGDVVQADASQTCRQPESHDEVL